MEAVAGRTAAALSATETLQHITLSLRHPIPHPLPLLPKEIPQQTKAHQARFERALANLHAAHLVFSLLSFLYF